MATNAPLAPALPPGFSLDEVPPLPSGFALDLPAPKETGAKGEGRRMNSSAQGVINALQGPTMGFLDELAGVGSGITGAIANLTPWGDNKSFAENYRGARDKVRGATEQFREDRPITAMATSIAASAPTIVAAPALKAAATTAPVVGPVARVAQALGSGAAYGAVGGAGESTAADMAALGVDTAKGAAISAALGAGTNIGGNVLGAVGSNIAQRMSQSSAANVAREKVAEALIRDARGTAFQSGRASPLEQSAARMGKLGNEATIADSGGMNTRALLDTLATLPGRTKDAAENMIRTRQAGRAGRITQAADEALGTGGKAYTATLDALDEAKKSAAQPLYEKLKGVTVAVDDDLNAILKAAPEAHGVAEKLARLRGEAHVDLSDISLKKYGLPSSANVPFESLDKVKQALYELAEGAKGEFGKPTATSNAYNDLRVRLTKRMDDLSPKESGLSIYAKARDAYGSRAELESAIKAGRTAMKTDAIGVAEITKGMGASEQEAFRIGALQSIRDKAGTEAGQSSLLRMWKEPATSGKLKEIFGNDYRQFAAAVAAEARLKGIESVGRGSQTAARQYGAGDLDAAAVGDVVNVASGAAKGNIAQAMGGVANIWNRVKMPEATRDEIGRILMSRGAAGTNELGGMTQAMRKVAEERARQAARAGAAGSLYLVQ